MFFTIFSVIIALFVYLNVEPTYQEMSYFALCYLTVIFLLYALYHSNKMKENGLFQKNATKTTPRIFKLLNKSVVYRSESLVVNIILFLVFVLIGQLYFYKIIPLTFILPGSLIFFGLFLDIILVGQNRVRKMIDPFHVVEVWRHSAEVEASSSEDFAFVHSLGSMLEVGIKAIQRGDMELAEHTLNQLPDLMGIYLGAIKSIGHQTDTSGFKEDITEVEEMNYVYYYLSERLHTMHTLAYVKSMEPFLNVLNTILGKLALKAAEVDFSLASFPLQHLGEFALSAQEDELMGVASRAELILLEVGRSLLRDKNIKTSNIKDPVLSIIENLELLAESNYRQNKDIDLHIITEPIRQLKECFLVEPAKSHPDTPILLARLQQTIDQFNTLEEMLLAAPKSPK